ncbi:hypothetical protein CWI36_0924p0010 [Hamiltosporidium magnivora]|uniref:Uncharacterized protein n=2 Tax=Hamiltosporidium magnivora TaxID=148818 RepID=A0A4Q9L892_9MICR|nr:hypothetical protein CWI36_0924p0010 [Hamiltosporidium magnivora]
MLKNNIFGLSVVMLILLLINMNIFVSACSTCPCANPYRQQGYCPCCPQQRPNPYSPQQRSCPCCPQQRPNPYSPQQRSCPCCPQQRSNPYSPQQRSCPCCPQQRSNPYSPQQRSCPCCPQQGSNPYSPQQRSCPCCPQQRSNPYSPQQRSCPCCPKQGSCPCCNQQRQPSPSSSGQLSGANPYQQQPNLKNGGSQSQQGSGRRVDPEIDRKYNIPKYLNQEQIDEYSAYLRRYEAGKTR